jgi:hypothetical protein
MADLEPLSEHESLRLLRAGVLGRVVVPTPDGMEIFPVNYTVTDRSVLIRTAPGSLLDRYADGATLLFETDMVDHDRWHGWSVVARGRGERVPDGELNAAERAVPGPPRWVSREHEVWIRLSWSEISGRRLGTGWELTSEYPVRRWEP